MKRVYVYLFFLELAQSGFIPPECQPIYLEYAYAGVSMKHCTVRRFNTGAETIYWMLYDCLSWTDANVTCGIGMGHLASFPGIEDKFYLQQFLSPLTTGYSTCFYPTANVVNSVWVGLFRTSSESNNWLWLDGSTEADVPFNPNIGNIAGTNYLPGNGNCVLAGWNSAYGSYRNQGGYINTDCASVKSRAVCMKVLN